MKKLTVIIPVFNAEKQIEKALASVINQLKSADLDIICINDGSTDNSEELIRSMIKKHNNIKLIQQTNLGPAAARNIALKRTKSCYVSFLDADDYLADNAYKLLIENIERTNADVTFHGYSTVTSDNELIRTFKIETQTFSSSHACFALFQKEFYGPSGCIALYRNDFLQKENLLFPTDSSYEDAYFFRNVIFAASSISVIDNILYYYVKNPGSRSNVLSLQRLKELCHLYISNLDSLYLSESERNILEGRQLINTLGFSDNRQCHQAMSSFFSKQLDDYPQIIIYGTGSSGQRIAEFLHRSKNIVYCDSNIDLEGTEIRGVPVISPESILTETYSKHAIIIGSIYIQEIQDRLIKTGIDNVIVIPGISNFIESINPELGA